MTDFGPAVQVTLHICAGEPEPGHWCDRCALPSAALVPLTGLHRYGIVDLARMVACPDCAERPPSETAATTRSGGRIPGISRSEP